MNKLPEKWASFQLKHLLHSIGKAPIISVSRKPMNLGTNIVDKNEPGYWNMYMKILDACRAADTPYIGIAEDDTLYTPEHFSDFRPPMDTVSYNRARWSLFAWDDMYCMRQRISNCSCISPRKLMIEALQERKEKYPNGCNYRLLGEVGRDKVDRRLGVSRRKMTEWYCHNPIVQLNHKEGNDTGHGGRLPDGRVLIKKHGQMKAYDIPYWGKATELLKHYLP